MKKWIAIFLAAVMAFGLTATAMASGVTLNQDTTSQTVEFSVVIPSTFTWAIPNFEPEVTTDKITAAGDIEFWDVYVPGFAGDIAVTITSKNGNCFKDELGNAILYTLTAPNPVTGKESYYLLCGDDADRVLRGNGVHSAFNVALEASMEGHYIAGTFSDELTFSAQTINRTDEKLTRVDGNWTYAG